MRKFFKKEKSEGNRVLNKTGVSSAKAERGFTLVEILVALALFITVMTIGLGSVINVLEANRKSDSLKSVMTNLNFALEVMSRDIKFGDSYSCSISTCSSGDTSIYFRNSDGINVRYRLNNSRIEKSVDNGATYQIITAPNIVVQDMRFYIFGYNTGDGAQPRVLISIRGYSGTKPSIQTTFVVQTTVSQRVLDS